MIAFVKEVDQKTLVIVLADAGPRLDNATSHYVESQIQDAFSALIKTQQSTNAIRPEPPLTRASLGLGIQRPIRPPSP